MKTDRSVLECVVEAAERFRSTPVVDDDFPAMRNDFDSALRAASRYIKETRAAQCPVIACLCGSTRFEDQYRAIQRTGTIDGYIILTCGAFKADNPTVEVKLRLDELHLRKIEMADEVWIINPGGYIGESTQREIDWANRLGKKVVYFNDALTRRLATDTPIEASTLSLTDKEQARP